MKQETQLISVEQVMSRIRGLRIAHGHETNEGFHLELEGGTVLIVTGDPLIVALIRANQTESVH